MKNLFLSCSFLLIFLWGCAVTYDDSPKEPVEVMDVKIYPIPSMRVSIFILEVKEKAGERIAYIEYHPNTALRNMVFLRPGTKINIEADVTGNYNDITSRKDIPHHKIKSITLIPGGEKYTF